MSFPAYPQYKESGLEWLGEVPEHWAVKRLKFIASVQTGVAKGKDNEGKDTIEVPYLRVANVQDGYFALDDVSTIEIPLGDLPRYSLLPGDVLMNEGGDFDKLGRGHVWQGEIEPCIHQNHVFSVRPSKVPPYWLSTYTSSQAAQFYFMGRSKQSTNLASISSSNLMELPVVVPPDGELPLILAFLDHETAHIDALIEEQQRLIELLKEKRQAVISHAVTKGLDPTVPMKDSCVEWLGEVPAHWEFGKVRYFAKLESGHTPSRGKPEYWENCTVPWFSLADVWQIRKGEVEEVFETKELVSELGLANSSARLLPKGTVILSRTASVGYSAIMGCAMATTQDFANWICGEKLFNYYLLYCFRAMSSEFLKLMMGSTHKTIYMPDIAELVCPVPPLDEQEKIASFIRESSSKFGNLVAEAERMKELLAERRSALISAAVTGKIDVRGWQPPAGTPSPESAIAEAH